MTDYVHDSFLSGDGQKQNGWVYIPDESDIVLGLVDAFQDVEPSPARAYSASLSMVHTAQCR